MPQSLEHPAERVLFVHAHPDDETLTTGGTIATLIANGDEPIVLTATRGERGEMLTPELAPLAGDAPRVAAHRERELRSALAALGGPRHLWLGSAGARATALAPRVYTDSGMQWRADGRAAPVSDAPEDALTRAPIDEVVADMRAAIRSTGAETIVSYDDDGGYGHPDHLRVHEAARRAAEAERVPFVTILGQATPASDSDIAVDVLPVRARVRAALEQYRSQLTVEAPEPSDPRALRWVMPHGERQEAPAVERFRRTSVGSQRVASTDTAGHPRPAAGPGSQLLGAVAMVIVGLVLGALGTVTHQVTAGSVALGAILDLALVACVLVGARLLLRSRLLIVLEALTCFGVTLALAYGFGSDTVLVPNNLAGQAWTLGQSLIAIIVIMWPDLSRIRGARRGAEWARVRDGAEPRLPVEGERSVRDGAEPRLPVERTVQPDRPE